MVSAVPTNPILLDTELEQQDIANAELAKEENYIKESDDTQHQVKVDAEEDATDTIRRIRANGAERIRKIEAEVKENINKVKLDLESKNSNIDQLTHKCIEEIKREISIVEKCIAEKKEAKEARLTVPMAHVLLGESFYAAIALGIAIQTNDLDTGVSLAEAKQEFEAKKAEFFKLQELIESNDESGLRSVVW
eukprot:CAMPEP_0201685750 /NCGR_PEP_ID=MMETSP0578-20130828/434_1 /ASSEMBLY_ACC=CAM_ASM_000663 /TAXON_ID=267565 /ORGANISM="Skeletonema grethea, Strain CCMP 1804" /LENGTH=192 /DNA_ID=CAMNT_0048169703 /DNA_START=102 /DNA_END=677 /DNA_ORIENTATION=-